MVVTGQEALDATRHRRQCRRRPPAGRARETRRGSRLGRRVHVGWRRHRRRRDVRPVGAAGRHGHPPRARHARRDGVRAHPTTTLEARPGGDDHRPPVGRVAWSCRSGSARSTTRPSATWARQTGVRERAAILDETLAILDGLWSGEPFGYQGEHYRFAPMTFLPRPVQRATDPHLGRRRRSRGAVPRARRPLGRAGAPDGRPG